MLGVCVCVYVWFEGLHATCTSIQAQEPDTVKSIHTFYTPQASISVTAAGRKIYRSLMIWETSVPPLC